MWTTYEVVKSQDLRAVAIFLDQFGLRYDRASDLTVEIRVHQQIVETGSLEGNVLQCIAVDSTMQGEGLSAKIVHYLMLAALRQGHTRVFIFTMPEQASFFASMGFRMLVKTEWAALLESGFPCLEDYLAQLESVASAVPATKDGKVGGLVVNCNPFTLGHQHLVAVAAKQCDHVYVLVVEENRSVFPFAVRLELVKQGTQHLKNVTVLPSGPYAVSAATFPSYFSEEETAHARAGASVDATLYATHIARALNVRVRYVGTEPYSPVTAIYNHSLREILAQHDIQLLEVPRLEKAGMAISASHVRGVLRAGDFSALGQLVPETTLAFLQSAQATDIINKIRQTTNRH